MELGQGSRLAGKSLAEAKFRSLTCASVVALVRAGRLTANPKSGTVFEAGDRIGVIGEKDQIGLVQAMIDE